MPASSRRATVRRAASGLALDPRTSPATLTRTEPSAAGATAIGSLNSGRPEETVSALDQASGGSASFRAAKWTEFARPRRPDDADAPGPERQRAARSSSAAGPAPSSAAGAVQFASFVVEWATWIEPSRTIASHSRPAPSLASDIDRTPRSVSRIGKSGSGRKPVAGSGE